MIEILSGPPRSGEWPERLYGEHFDSPLWVRFEPEASESWVGCFARPVSAASRGEDCVAAVGTTAVVSAGGYGYVLNVESGAQLRPVDARVRVQALRRANGYPLIVAVVEESLLWGRIDLIDASGEARTVARDLHATGVRLEEQQGNCLFGSLVEVVGSEFDLRFEIDLERQQFWMLEEVEDHVFLRYLHKYTKRPASLPADVAPPPPHGEAAAGVEDYGPFVTPMDQGKKPGW